MVCSQPAENVFTLDFTDPWQQGADDPDVLHGPILPLAVLQPPMRQLEIPVPWPTGHQQQHQEEEEHFAETPPEPHAASGELATPPSSAARELADAVAAVHSPSPPPLALFATPAKPPVAAVEAAVGALLTHPLVRGAGSPASADEAMPGGSVTGGSTDPLVRSSEDASMAWSPTGSAAATCSEGVHTPMSM